VNVLTSNGEIIGSILTEGDEPTNSGRFSVSLSFPGLVQNAQYFIAVTACVDVVCRESKSKQFCEYSIPKYLIENLHYCTTVVDKQISTCVYVTVPCRNPSSWSMQTMIVFSRNTV